MFYCPLKHDNPGSEIQGYHVLGGSKDLLGIAGSENISDLIFSISHQMSPEMFQALLKAEELGIEITTMPISYEELLGRVPIRLLQSDWIIRSFVDHAHMSGFYEAMKRLMDIIGSFVGLILFALLLPIVSLSILIDSGWPIFYTQNRLGKNARLYKIIKFRTMYKDAEKDGSIRPAEENDERVTRVGKFLRKSRIDEFPQFINIILGEMSLVGPRAERPELAERLQTNVPFYRARLLVKPGLSGWAQVNFGYASSVDDTTIKLEYDLYYIKHRNIALDFTILVRTIGTVIGFRGM
jgi:lipopolysaccharide/colanic/teichoic acid biosynthesis glycosyltransferase